MSRFVAIFSGVMLIAPLGAQSLETLRRQGRYEAAIKLAQKNNAPPLKLATLYLDVDRFDDALTIFKQHCKTENAVCQNQWGVTLVATGKYRRACSFLINAVASSPHNEAYHANLALCYDYLKQFKQAAQHYNRALKLAPDNKITHLNYAAFLIRRKQFHQGRTILNELLAKDKTLFFAHLYLGISYMQTSDYQQALTHLNRGIQLNSTHFDLYINRARVRYKLGSKRGALMDLELAEKLKPYNTQIMPLRAMMQ